MADYDAQPGRAPDAAPQPSPVQLEAHELDLYAGLAGVASIVAGTRRVDEILSEIAEFAVLAIPGVDGAGVTLLQAGGQHRVETWAVTTDFVRDIDAVQYDQFGEGPCLTCIESHRPTVSGSMGNDARWPRFGGRVARMGVHSVLALPLLVHDDVVGAINAYARTRDAFGDHAVQTGSRFSKAAAVAVHNARLLDQAHERTQQLQRALQSRAVIDQAVGIIRSRTGEDAAGAFQRLVRLSQGENTRLAVVAERLVEESVRRARARRR
ncbi:GAF and ANTAR domain-containing protein [Mycolicibacterium confluentis]|uniref:Transcriptional regulator n=1 Tax=Mycolicibacterium confluentis TaxID=28047 RepID=A0A7I7XV49_9MYCO|nr:GAF and ANTAR domain-containing protein [Mycolicibacterium confluentis]MCV7322285.1 GAF and ANTAR domain-containing protein [Mycolicibacterium confluentis]ORV28393.1 histidine kinase [Mycolicibacterium confluentis]BBZ33031.1 transcriptional regulator [Mycolicibacterium confluentis]